MTSPLQRLRAVIAADAATDTVTVNVPLLIRLLEFAREDLDDDIQLHVVVERIIAASKQKEVLTMDDYRDIVVSPELSE